MAARILVIEDNPVNLSLMTYLLKSLGHTALEAADGEQGLRLAEQEQPDLIICDVQMPVVDGYEVARRVKQIPALAQVPLIAVTAHAMVGDQQRIMAAGFDGYFSKPIDPESFVHDVQEFLPSGLARSASAAPASTAPPRERRPQTHTVLVVDDEPVNHRLASSLLESSGYRVVKAQGMRMALEMVGRSRPYLIVSDVCMDDGDGYEFIQRLKADPEFAAIPVVFITATDTTEKARQRGLALGAADFLFRPMESEFFLQQIRACMEDK